MSGLCYNYPLQLHQAWSNSSYLRNPITFPPPHFSPLKSASQFQVPTPLKKEKIITGRTMGFLTRSNLDPIGLRILGQFTIRFMSS